MNNLTIEDELRARTRKDPDAEDLWNRYANMKRYLELHYYPWIQANCPFYTDHGELHIRSVIHAVSQLLAPHLKKSPRQSDLTSLDLFLLLSSILWHDVGNVYGRSGHAKRVTEMTRKIKTLGFPNPDIQRLVNEIAIAHAGENGLDIPRGREDCSTSNKTYTVYPLALAALVRFADEVSENQSRISHTLLPDIPKENQIYWRYASCIAASLPDASRQRVRITVNIPDTAAPELHFCDDYPERFEKNELSLIEYIVCRIEKMNNERAYCAPHFSRYVSIREIEVLLTLTHDDARIDNYEDVVVFGDGGLRQEAYPMIDVFEPFFTEHPQWNPDEISKATGT